VVQEVTTRGKDIIADLRAALVQCVGAARYDLWLSAVNLILQDDTLCVESANRFTLDAVRNQAGDEIKRTAAKVLGADVAVAYRVNEIALTSPAAKAVTNSVYPTSTSNTQLSLGLTLTGEHPQQSADAAADPAAGYRRRFDSLESLVVGSSNSLAFKSAEIVLERPGSFSPLFVHGPTGVGKTHLLEGIYSAFKRQRQLSRFAGVPVYLSAEQFTSQFLEALHGSGLPLFRRKYRDVGLLLIDDVQFFVGKRATLTELLHTIDSLLGAGRQLVFAADRAPAALKALGPELAARFAGGMVCRIDVPDYETRLQIVRQLAGRFGMTIPESVAAYIATHFTSHARELSGALKRLEASSLALARPMTLELAEHCLADLVHQHHQPVRLPDIEKAVCEVFGLQPDSLKSNRKAKEVSLPRMLAMFLARKYTRTPLSEIGNFFGQRAHSTVISAQKKITSMMANGSANGAHGPWNVDEVIRRIEEQLRAS
jgi:chromosomal replication initiator protein